MCTHYLHVQNATEFILFWNFIFIILLGIPLAWMRLNCYKWKGNDRGLCSQLGKYNKGKYCMP